MPDRAPVIAVRVAPALHQEIAENARASARTMSAEMGFLLREVLDARKRFPSSAAAEAMEAATLAFLSGGERYGRDNEIDIPWTDDLESRRNAALAMCITIITQFVSSDAREQVLTVAALEAGFRPRLFDSECQTQGFGLAHWRFL